MKIKDKKLLALYDNFLTKDSYSKLEVARIVFSSIKGVMEGSRKALDRIAETEFKKGIEVGSNIVKAQIKMLLKSYKCGEHKKLLKLLKDGK